MIYVCHAGVVLHICLWGGMTILFWVEFGIVIRIPGDIIEPFLMASFMDKETAWGWDVHFDLSILPIIPRIVQTLSPFRSAIADIFHAQIRVKGYGVCSGLLSIRQLKYPGFNNQEQLFNSSKLNCIGLWFESLLRIYVKTYYTSVLFRSELGRHWPLKLY